MTNSGVNIVNNVNNRKNTNNTSISNPSTPTIPSEAIRDDVSKNRVNITYNTYITRTKENYSSVLSVRLRNDIGLELKRLASERHLKPSEFARWILTDNVEFFRLHPDKLPDIPGNPIVVAYRELPNLANNGKNARTQALDSYREELYDRLARVKEYYGEARKGNRPYDWVKDLAEELIDTFNTYHSKVRNLPEELLKQDKEAKEELKRIVSNCQGKSVVPP